MPDAATYPAQTDNPAAREYPAPSTAIAGVYEALQSEGNLELDFRTGQNFIVRSADGVKALPTLVLQYDSSPHFISRAGTD